MLRLWRRVCISIKSTKYASMAAFFLELMTGLRQLSGKLLIVLTGIVLMLALVACAPAPTYTPTPIPAPYPGPRRNNQSGPVAGRQLQKQGNSG